MNSRRLVALVGPTAAGKTALAVEAVEACSFPVEIVSLDSRQIYRQLDVGTGKPTAEERRRAPHHLVDVLDPVDTFDAGRYRREVDGLVPQLWNRGVTPLLVGGSGFYLRALREGFHDLPDEPEKLAGVRREHAAQSLAELRRQLEVTDAPSAARIHPHDRYRTERALEILALTGRRASELEAEFRARPLHDCAFDVVHVTWPRDRLHDRIERRARAWLSGAWQTEVEALLAAGLAADSPGLSILGYREVVAHLRGDLTAAQTEERVIVATRRYARQQEIWFRKSGASWRGEPEDAAALAALTELLERARCEGPTP
jgi:tRNA dimethylallyltransferase